MCSDYQRRKAIRDYERAFSDLRLPILRPEPHAYPNLEPQDDVRPTDRAPIFRAYDGGVEMVQARWGLVPVWHRGALKDWKMATFNARAETVATSRTFREAYAKRRALVPADGWYEWTGPKGEKQRWRFTRKDGRELFFAGLWERCRTDDHGEVESFTIVTQPAGAPLNAWHDRAPVVLDPDAVALWLDLERDASDLLGPESVDLFQVEKAEPLRMKKPSDGS